MLRVLLQRLALFCLSVGVYLSRGLGDEASFAFVRSAQAAPRVFRMLMGSEPPQLNSTKATDQESAIILNHVLEGLTRYGKNGEIIEGMAERWDIRNDGATFWLRHNAVWADGKPVTARDFVFAWRTVVDPKTASEYAFILYPIKNAQAVSEGKMPTSQLGAVAVDDWTLEVTFEKPCGYFLGLTAFTTYLPLREDFYELKGERYAADAEDLLSNGPFRLTRWLHGAALTLEKNQSYWAADRIHLDAIEVPNITPDPNVAFNLFLDRKIDYFNIVSDSLDRAQAERLPMKAFADGSVWYLEFNHRPDRVTRSRPLRRAMQLAFDPKEYVSRVVKVPGSRPGSALIPGWIQGVEQSFRTEYPRPVPAPNLEAARKELEAAKAELGGEVPPLSFLIDDGPTAARQAEYIQNHYKKTLGIDLRIDKQTFKQRLAKMTDGQFDIVAAGWGPDFADPMTYAELFTSWNDNNRGKYQSDVYDGFIRQAQASADPSVRMPAMAAAEARLLEDAAIVPLYERVRIYARQPYVSGIVRHAVGSDVDLLWVQLRN